MVGGGWGGWRVKCKTDLYDKQLAVTYNSARVDANSAQRGNFCLAMSNYTLQFTPGSDCKTLVCVAVSATPQTQNESGYTGCPHWMYKKMGGAFRWTCIRLFNWSDIWSWLQKKYIYIRLDVGIYSLTLLNLVSNWLICWYVFLKAPLWTYGLLLKGSSSFDFVELYIKKINCLGVFRFHQCHVGF